ncbi:TPT-domain-containing protein [Trametes coccinea BRFM310]|uniref:TPT-domain-containing protein n=1 Tax=Trametes coccinea (strain BRFM310) TaxID=1353009 RepID=A0A1Y2IH68_TRAC3|nr:TPT-domain-containing protein [Trametes coccinea BRFM310]
MDVPTFLQSRLAYSPRQRAGFPREAIYTPAIDLAVSPLVSDAGFPSPSLPVVSPDAPAATKTLIARKTAERRRRRSMHVEKRSEAFWLALYFAFNLGLTLYNKGVLVRFPYPYTLTAVHALCGTLGGYALRSKGMYQPARLDVRSYAVLAAFSVLYSVNIAISNLSLQLVTIPFHQVVRAATPIFTTLLSALILGSTISSAKIAALAPVMLGVILATYGEYYFTALGLLLTLLGTILAALKTIYTNVLQSHPKLTRRPESKRPTSFLLPPSLNLHPLDLLTRMSPLAFVQCVAYAYMSGEFNRIQSPRPSNPESTLSVVDGLPLLLLLGNGIIAFGLNVVSFTANGKVGALNMTVAANVKQVLTIVLAVAVFDLTITPTNALGIMITLLGGAWYAAVEYSEKTSSRQARMGEERL